MGSVGLLVALGWSVLLRSLITQNVMDEFEGSFVYINMGGGGGGTGLILD